MATIIELKAEIKELASNQTYLRDQSKSKYNGNAPASKTEYMGSIPIRSTKF